MKIDLRPEAVRIARSKDPGSRLADLIALLPEDDADWEMVRSRARQIASDGCTAPTQIYHRWCLLHDCCYSCHGLYVRVRWGQVVVKVTRDESDDLFAHGMRRDSPVKGYDPVAFVRWQVLRRLGGPFWELQASPKTVRRVAISSRPEAPQEAP